jgi:hypothetical protein
MTTSTILTVVLGLLLAEGHPQVVRIYPDGSEGSLRPEPSLEPAAQEVVADKILGRIPVPRLPTGYAARDAGDVKRVLEIVENEVITLAMIKPAFVDGITDQLARQFATTQRPYLHPSAIYYAIIAEAGQRHGNKTAAKNLLVSYRDGTIARYAKLPAKKRSL